ncbi:urea ABC transporter permease subunit UrtB [Marinomonas sp. S3726]|uniref:urea ABC transporter permease subunit UrtB n=1 Tax=Marinomonas sp. S3726 TaxID=579484 RepID=UPI0005FA22F3|nr:urea ABC transporter permease subunit UrtB [Marinomonas sp. S3726]
MKQFHHLICCLIASFTCAFFSAYAVANNSQASQSAKAKSDSELLVALTQVKLKQMNQLLGQIKSSQKQAALPLFKTLLEGRLYYVRSDNHLIQMQKTGKEKYYFELESATALPHLTKKLVKKVKLNNSVRRYLRSTIAELELSHPDAKIRAAALQSLLSNLETDLQVTIEERRTLETDDKVIDLLDVALNLYQLKQSESAALQIKAIEQLASRLEIPVKNQLTTVAETSSDPAVKQAAFDALKEIEHSTNRYELVDQLFFGLSLGSVLLLASIGLAITFGVMGVINMAHGEMIMLGAYTTYVVQLLMPNHIDYSLWVAIPAAFMVSGLMGVIIERGVIRHLHGRPLETLLATFGISLILQQLVRSVFSPLNRQVFSPSWMTGSLEINPILSLTLNRLYILAFALIVFFALLTLLRKTSLGLNVRAVSQNRNMAKAMGVKTGWVDAMTFGLGSGIAGIAGVALSQLTNVGPNLGQAYIIDSFMVVVFGGVGNLFGTLVAAFSLGIATKFLEPVTGAVLAAIIVLVFIILFIQKRPKGLFPQKGRAAE